MYIFKLKAGIVSRAASKCVLWLDACFGKRSRNAMLLLLKLSKKKRLSLQRSSKNSSLLLLRPPRLLPDKNNRN